jgi:hypothetical protein
MVGSTREEQKIVIRRLLKIRGVEDVAWEQVHERLRIRYAAETVDPGLLRTEIETLRVPGPA